MADERGVSRSSAPFLLLDIPSVNSYPDDVDDDDSTTNIPNEMTIERVRSFVEQLLFNADSAKKRSKLSDLRLLVCFMCGGASNDIEIFVLQLAARFVLTVLNSSSVMINVVLEQSRRKVSRERCNVISRLQFSMLGGIGIGFVSFALCNEIS